jgi:hypothetical protein
MVRLVKKEPGWLDELRLERVEVVRAPDPHPDG